MSSPPCRIDPDTRVVMHFALLLEDGTEIVSTFDEEPICFMPGAGTMEPALENKLTGMRAGDEQALLLAGSDVYGERDEENRQWLDRREFPAALELNEGHVVAFTTAAGDELAGTLASIGEERILIDFNHPLSGRTFIFKVAILQVDSPE